MKVNELIAKLQSFSPDMEITHYAESAPRYAIDCVLYNKAEGIVCTCSESDEQEAIRYGDWRYKDVAID